MTIAPDLTQSALTNLARPIATTRTSALRQIEGRSTVFEWHMVTVASASLRREPIGDPTSLLLPMTTAFFPLRSIPVDFISSIQPFGVHGMKASVKSP